MRQTAILCLALFLAGPAHADFPCDALWSERNAIYADAGYCFRTTRGIKAFGNAGCRFDDINDVPLSARQRRDVADIVRRERQNACRD